MNIGILTFHHSLNHGAMLQAYFLQAHLSKKGYNVEFINYSPTYLERGCDLASLFRVSFSRSYAKRLYLFLASNIASLKYKILLAKFKSFQTENLNINCIQWQNISEIGNISAKYDTLIIGSDQVWNPSDQFGLDPIYFGEPLLPYAKKIISYAASFGSVVKAYSHLDKLPILLSSLQAISVRESSANVFLKSIDIDSEIVPDPTFLSPDVSQYGISHSHIQTEEPYAFFYILRDAHNMHKLSNSLLNNQRVSSIYSAATPWRRWRKIGSEIQLSPFELIAAINNSHVTVSNSFHGVALSLLTATNFLAVELPGSRNTLSSRVKTYLKNLIC